jgi:hypothetical protein
LGMLDRTVDATLNHRRDRGLVHLGTWLRSTRERPLTPRIPLNIH